MSIKCGNYRALPQYISIQADVAGQVSLMGVGELFERFEHGSPVALHLAGQRVQRRLGATDHAHVHASHQLETQQTVRNLTINPRINKLQSN